MAEELAEFPEETGSRMVAKAIELLNALLLSGRSLKITKSQYLMFLLADMITWVEVAKATCLKAVSEKAGKTFSDEFILAVARLFARETAEKVYINTLKIVKSSQETPENLTEKLNFLDLNAFFEDYLKDMDLIAKELVS